MLNLEQVKLLETKVAQTIEYVDRLTGENAVLRKNLEADQKRIEELELLASRFKEEQGRIEDGILSALDRLCQFESAIEKSLASRKKEAKHSKAPDSEKNGDKTPVSAEPEEEQVESIIPEYTAKRAPANEYPPAEIQDPLESEEDSDYQPDSDTSSSEENGELDIF